MAEYLEEIWRIWRSNEDMARSICRMSKDIWRSNEDIWRSIWRKYGVYGGVMRIYGEEYM